MKRLVVILVVLSLVACSALVYAAEKQEQGTESQSPAKVRPERPGPQKGLPDASQIEAQRQMRGHGPAGPEGQPMQNMQEFAKKQHEQMISELEAIKKIAEGEKATKTVEAIQKLIDTKNADFKTRQTEMEKRRTEMMERMRQRQQGREQGPPPAGTEGQQLQPGTGPGTGPGEAGKPPMPKGGKKKAGQAPQEVK